MFEFIYGYLFMGVVLYALTLGVLQNTVTLKKLMEHQKEFWLFTLLTILAWPYWIWYYLRPDKDD